MVVSSSAYVVCVCVCSFAVTGPPYEAVCELCSAAHTRESGERGVRAAQAAVKFCTY